MPVSRRAAAASASGPSSLGRRGPSEPCDELLAQTRDDLVAEADHVAALGLEGIEDRDPGEHVAHDEGLDEGVDRGLVRQPQQVGDGLDRDRIVRADEDLVEHRLRVPHAAARSPRDERERVGLDASPLGLEDALELALDLGAREGPEREALEARHDGRADLARIGRAEDEQDAVGRLLERLEEDVPALLDALDLVDDEHLALEVRGGRVDAREQLAHVVDLVVRRGVELDDVKGTSFPDGLAGGTAVAWLPVTEVGAVHRLREDPRHRRLARAPRADEEEAVTEASEAHRVAERPDHGVLADDLVERLRPEAPVQGSRRNGARGRRGRWARLGHRSPGRPVDDHAVHPPSTTAVRGPDEAISSDQAGPRHPASSA